MNQERWSEAVQFHGHACPGLAIGFRAVEAAEKALGKSLYQGTDEDFVCVAENDACGVDAIIYHTDCTPGKGNFLFRLRGKQAFSFFIRGGESVRVVLKPRNREMTREEWQEELLSKPVEELFEIKKPHYEVPERARIFENQICAVCGESTMELMLRIEEGKTVCLDCAKSYDRGF